MATRENTLSAQTTATASTSKFGEFEPFVGATKSILYILKSEANHSKSMKLLDEAGLRPLKYQEILPLLMRDETFKNALKGTWFYLAGEGLKEHGIYTNDKEWNLIEIIEKREKNLTIEQRVLAWKGTNPLSLSVYSDFFTTSLGERFHIDAAGYPHKDAPVVVGVPKLSAEHAEKMLRSDLEAQK